MNATSHHALVGPHRPLDQNGQRGTAGSLDELVHWAQIQLAGSRQALRLADVLRVLQLGEGGYPIASGAEVYLKEIADLLADLKGIPPSDLIKKSLFSFLIRCSVPVSCSDGDPPGEELLHPLHVVQHFSRRYIRILELPLFPEDEYGGAAFVNDALKQSVLVQHIVDEMVLFNGLLDTGLYTFAAGGNQQELPPPLPTA